MKVLAAACLAVAASGALAADRLDLQLGRALFERDWATGAASAGSADGLGPLFNARSCAGCHKGPAFGALFTAIDGRLAGQGLVLRLADRDARPDPAYGRQLQNRAVPGLTAEGRILFRAPLGVAGPSEVAVAFSHGAPAPETRLSFRQAPPLVGRGALERIADGVIASHADPDDADGDGISGRVNWIRTENGARAGRFGWKARHADLESQVAEAFAIDLGLSSPDAPGPPGDCTALQTDCLVAPSGASAATGGQELSHGMVRLVRDFVADLPRLAAEPPRHPALFVAAGCAACHVPAMADATGADIPAYTDLLLHDMGPALDDGMGEPGVTSAEWRTAPLIGMSAEAGRRRYLHDGRAATLDQAVRAHGGEASGARRRYEALAAPDRAALLAFVATL